MDEEVLAHAPQIEDENENEDKEESSNRESGPCTLQAWKLVNRNPQALRDEHQESFHGLR